MEIGEMKRLNSGGPLQGGRNTLCAVISSPESSLAAGDRRW
jgi:hypothetical protein